MTFPHYMEDEISGKAQMYLTPINDSSDFSAGPIVPSGRRIGTPTAIEGAWPERAMAQVLQSCGNDSNGNCCRQDRKTALGAPDAGRLPAQGYIDG